MANPNPEIWGAPETWLDQNIMQTENSYPALKAGKAKVASFRNLYNGIGQGKFNFGVDPIDNTVCPVGQDPAVSCFGKLYVVGVSSIPATDVIIPEVIKEFEMPVNWCFTEGGSGTQGWSIRNYVISCYTDAASSSRWLPNTGTINTDSNRNTGVCPFVYYQLKTLLLSIKVQLIDGYSDSNNGNMPYSQNQQWVTLADWKNNYPTKKAYRIKFDINSVHVADTTNIAYQNTSSNMPNFCTVSVALLDGLELIKNDNTVFYDYATFQIEAKSQSFDLVNTIHGSSDAFARHLFMAVDKFENATIRTTKGTSDNYVYCAWQEIPYTEKNYESIMKMVACFGVPFTDTNKLSFKLDFTDTELCLPVIDENGVAHGEYTRGTANTTNDLYNADSVRDKNYDPTKPPTPIDPNTYSDTTNWNNVNFRQAFTKRYILNSAQVAQLSTELWAAQSSKPADLDFQNYVIDEYLTNNPIDTIVSLKHFPCTFADAAPAVVHLGKYTTKIAATALGTSVRVIDFDPIAVWRHFGDFRDFEPYTQLSVYIPFCGVVPLKTADCMGKYVAVKLCIDTSTGAAAGFVIVSNTGSGGICVATANGTAAIDIPVSGLQSANISNAVFNAAATWAQTQINNSAGTNLLANLNSPVGTLSKGFSKMFNLGDLKGAVLGGPVGAFGVLANADPTKAYAKGAEMDLENARAEYDLQHVQMPTRLIGSSAPALSSVMETAVRLIIYRPITDEKGLANYADTVGFATLQSGTVSQFSGFTVGTIDVSGINATATEKQAIAAAFANGVYL